MVREKLISPELLVVFYDRNILKIVFEVLREIMYYEIEKVISHHYLRSKSKLRLVVKLSLIHI